MLLTNGNSNASLAAVRWYIQKGDGERGPYTSKELHRSVKRGQLSPTSLVRGENETSWGPLMTSVPAPISEHVTETGDLIDEDAAGREHREMQAAAYNMKIGGVVCIAGLFLTLFTYASGGRVVVAGGAIVFGALQFYRGYSRSRQAHRR